MYEYEMAVFRTRRFLTETLEWIYHPFADWSETHRMILIMGLVAFVGYVVARPPSQKKKRYGPDGAGNFFIVACMIVVGTFVMGLSMIDATNL